MTYETITCGNTTSVTTVTTTNNNGNIINPYPYGSNIGGSNIGGNTYWGGWNYPPTQPQQNVLKSYGRKIFSKSQSKRVMTGFDLYSKEELNDPEAELNFTIVVNYIDSEEILSMPYIAIEFNIKTEKLVYTHGTEKLLKELSGEDAWEFIKKAMLSASGN